MPHCPRFSAALFPALFAALCGLLPAGPALAQQALPPRVQEALRQAGVPASALAAVAVPLGQPAGRQVWRHQADLAMQPASTMKLVTAIVALDRLGPNLRGFTELRSAAPLVNGVLQGDLVLKGGADPDLGLPQLWAMLADLRQQGLVEIAGDLVIDRSLFNPARGDVGLPPFDESPEFPYNVIPDALQLAGNLLTVQLQSDAQGVTAEARPPLPGVTLTSHMTLTERPCKDWDEDWRPARVTHDPEGRTLIELQGAFPRQCTRRAELQLMDRDELAQRLFATLWQGLGGSWTGRVRALTGGEAPAGTPAPLRVLARHEARPWGEVLRGVMKTSDNPLTRLLFLQLGVAAMAAEPQTPTAELAAREVRGWLAEHSIDAQGLVLDNGSGLSRSERITPWQLASMLKVAAAGRRAPELLASLPVAGEDGTLRRRFKDSPAAGAARLKTGTLRNVVALAGYVDDARGRPWAVVAVINHDDAMRARPAIDALIDGIARSGPPAPAGHARRRPVPPRS